MTQKKALSILELAIIIGLASVPLFISQFPYRVNIFLSWEGAYRISQGQIPFRDFGQPMGGMYWVMPAFFFKLFGPQLISLLKAQVFINIISGLAFRSMLKSLQVQEGIRISAVLLFCISFSFFNFWPWYNHTVIVYEFVALAFLLKYLSNPAGKYRWIVLGAAAFFTFISFFTKQDAGGMCLLICGALLLYSGFIDRNWKQIMVYFGIFFLLLAVAIISFRSYEFGYWFNHGQAPHSARISIGDIAGELLKNSQWIKFYFFLTAFLTISSFKNFKTLLADKQDMLFLLLTLGILTEAAIFQVTSYTPPDNNIFYHSFAFAFIFNSLAKQLKLSFKKWSLIICLAAGVFLWWSNVFWKYLNRLAPAVKEEGLALSDTGENVVNKNNYMLTPDKDTTTIPDGLWVQSGLWAFEKIAMPEPTVQGIKRILNMDIVKQGQAKKILNMTELTPLAYEVPFELEKGPSYPLWHHLGVGMFSREEKMFEKRIETDYYDLVLFEYIPTLNHFYPFSVRDALQKHYELVDSFYAPRRGDDTKGTVEVYIKKPK